MDHVPPRNLFPEPRPSNLVTVPACGRCNERASQDDEYFRNNLASRADVGGQSGADQVLAVALRSLAKPEAGGLRRSFLRSIMPVDLYSTGGIYLGAAPGYRVNMKRINRVAARTVSGLFFKVAGMRLADQYRATACCLSGVGSVDPRSLAHFEEALRLLGAEPATTIGNGVFTYRVRRVEDDPFGSIWLLAFYERVIFVGGTLPKSFKLEPTPGAKVSLL
jgi:hypothetical protein